jgi:hypothetical protein
MLLPALAMVIAWPTIAWIAMILNAPPEWFAHRARTGMEIAADGYGYELWTLKAQIFGGLTLQAGWLAVLAMLTALFPKQARWLLRPLLDQWNGRGRWPVAIGCAVSLALFAVIWGI